MQEQNYANLFRPICLFMYPITYWAPLTSWPAALYMLKTIGNVNAMEEQSDTIKTTYKIIVGLFCMLTECRICCTKSKKVFSCFLNDPVSRVDLISTGSLFHAFGAAMANARSEDTSLDRGTTSSSLSAEQSDDARPGLYPTGFTSSEIQADGNRRVNYNHLTSISALHSAQMTFSNCTLLFNNCAK